MYEGALTDPSGTAMLLLNSIELVEVPATAGAVRVATPDVAPTKPSWFARNAPIEVRLGTDTPANPAKPAVWANVSVESPFASTTSCIVHESTAEAEPVQ